MPSSDILLQVLQRFLKPVNCSGLDVLDFYLLLNFTLNCKILLKYILVFGF